MIPVTVTLQYERDGRPLATTVRLSMDMTVQAAIGTAIDTLKLPADDSYRLSYRRVALDPAAKLYSAGIIEGAILQLTRTDPAATLASASEAGAMVAGLLQRLGASGAAGPLPIPAALAALHGGPVFTLTRTRALIGRADERIGFPASIFDAELSALDPDRTVSRPHALIVFSPSEGNSTAFTIRDLYSRRGVIVNQARLSPSHAQPIVHGDVITLGDVQLEFLCR
jgi:hypothetical protein